jgi:hypothetical protein
MRAKMTHREPNGTLPTGREKTRQRINVAVHGVFPTELRRFGLDPAACLQNRGKQMGEQGVDPDRDATPTALQLQNQAFAGIPAHPGTPRVIPACAGMTEWAG